MTSTLPHAVTSARPIPPLYRVDVGGQLQPHLSSEYLLTNGMGAFSSSSVVGCNTRRYHSLLVAATQPPLGRINTLSRVGEILYVGGNPADPKTGDVHELGVNLFDGSVHPRGYAYLRAFELGTTAVWRYEVEGIHVTKELQLVWGQNLAALRYTLTPTRSTPVRLELLPFVAMRDFHALRRGTDHSFRVVPAGGHLKVEQGGWAANHLHVRASAGEFVPGEDWWRGHKYPVEAERGQDDTEDLFNPGRFVIESASGAISVTLYAGLADPGERDFDADLRTHPDYTAPANRVVPPRGPVGAAMRAAKGSQPDLPKALDSANRDLPSAVAPGVLSPTIKRLLRAASDFVVLRNRPDGKAGSTVLAGYPWFADWGRDTMISLPGLLLVPGRFTEACQVLTLFSEYVSEGMIPNKFDDYTNEPCYNTVDASLWFVHACFEYLKYSGDQTTFDHRLLPACKEIVRGYTQGTRYHIKMDEADGLIHQGDPSTQLTWMDAKMGDTVFTPRQGKPVEINALWHHALRLLGDHTLADRVRDSFVKAFWISPFRGLADVVRGGPGAYERDTAVRPNQVFAVSLEHSPLAPEQQTAVVEVVRRELLTPYGLRTLSRGMPGYQGRYTGDQWHRDGAYHNGTVWPWLIGGFLEGYLKSHAFSAEAMGQVREWLTPLITHMETAGCIGQIPELFDGDAPQRPVGTPAQAWSVAEVLRVAAMVGM
ncbi:MAG: amylo-alpha-1,6-glucosidase [Phycisphaerae bacterium]